MKLRKALPEIRRVFIAIKPSLARWNMAETMRDANQRIAADCEKDMLLTFVDVWKPMLGEDSNPRWELFVDDGLHLNDEGYKLWAKLLLPHLVSQQDAERTKN